jgi:hypothetical protein
MTAAAEGYGVPGIVSALVTCDAFESFGKDIDDLSFSFIAPLKSNDCDVLFHDCGWVGLRDLHVTFEAGEHTTSGQDGTITCLVSDQVLVQCFGDHVLADSADNLLSDLAILEEK